MSIDISEEDISSIFRTEKWSEQETSLKAGGKHLVVSCPDYFSTLKMEAICSSETSVDTQWTTLRHISENGYMFSKYFLV
jgi:hypothetical protein